MRNISELIGIIKGINFDGVINYKEVLRLQTWVDKNRNLVTDSIQRNLVRLVEEAIEDKAISKEERDLLLTESERILRLENNANLKIFELNGIIEGIICDGEVNEEEVRRLKEWMNECKDSIGGHKTSLAFCKAVDDILEDGMVTEEEQVQLLEMLASRIGASQLEIKLDHLRKHVKNRKNIGIDLIEILDNADAMDEIHRQAERQLLNALNSHSGAVLMDPEIVVISLVLIAMLEYDGNYYENVRSTYSDLYRSFSEQKVEGLIRSILNRYRPAEEKSSRARIINVVLKNAIVPSHFLSDFFEFIYDIYKLNFEYDLSDDLYEDFKFVYEGLRSNMLSDGDDVEINVTHKTYKLIRATKQLIADEQQFDAIIRLSIIVAKLIDKKTWNKEVKIHNPYIKGGYENWVALLKDERTEGRKSRATPEFRSRWEPKFMLENNQVYLILPIHKVKSQYNYWDIKVVVMAGEKIVYESKKPDIREIIGGYQVTVNRIRINEPLDSITYRLMAGQEVLYDSKSKLIRNFIVFNIDGQEIQNNTDYKGTAIFCYKNQLDCLNPYHANDYYKLASRNVKFEDAIVIENTLFNFSSLSKPGVFGEPQENCFLLRQNDNSTLPVYKKVKFLVFESVVDNARYEVAVNNNHYRLTDLKCTISERENAYKYVVDLNIEEPGIYTIAVHQIDSGKRSRIAFFELAYDPDLDFENIKLDDYTFMISVKTALCTTTINADFNIKEYNLNFVQFNYKGVIYSYQLPFSFDIYRLSSNSWVPTSDPMWVGDVSQDTIMDVFGAEANGLILYSNTGKVLEEEMQLRDKGIYKQIPIGFILSYKSSCDYVLLGITQNGRINKAIYCYNKCIIREDETEIVFDPIKKSLMVRVSYYGKGNVYFQVYNAKQESVYKSGILEQGVEYEVFSLNSFEKYTICFYEKPRGLALNNYVLLKSYERIFYAREDFVNRSLRLTRSISINWFVENLLKDLTI
jgi:hypothetical protein